MESTKYILKDLGEQVPLFNPSTKSYMIVVDNEPLDIPEKLFKTLFVEAIPSKPKPIEIPQTGSFEMAKDMRATLRSQIGDLMKTGMPKDSIKALIVGTIRNIPELRDMTCFIDEVFDSIEG